MKSDYKQTGRATTRLRTMSEDGINEVFRKWGIIGKRREKIPKLRTVSVLEVGPGPNGR